MARPKNFEKQGDHTGPRVRASEAALRTALKALKAEGLSVGKLCITGGQVEIHVGGIEANPLIENDGGPEDW